MLYNLNLEQLLFIDIETVPDTEVFEDLDPEMQQLWDEKTRFKRLEGETPAEFYEKAGIWAEFGRIICISAGHFSFRGNKRSFRTTSYFGEEKQLLQQFKNLLETHYSGPSKWLCGHNIKEFDLPYICRRMVVHQIPLPDKLQLYGKKPWEIGHIDTLELWKFGDFKNYTSLKLLSKLLGIPSPKEDIDGSMVSKVYYKDQDLDRIVRYCEKDVIATAQLLLRFRTDSLLGPEEILHV